MGRASTWRARNLQTVCFHLFVAEHADSRRRNRVQIFTVTPKLLMISRDEIHTVWRHQLAQWLRCSPCVDGRAVVQISSDENRIRRFLQNLRDHTPQEIAVSNVPKVHVTDQCRCSAAPCCRKIREPHRRARDARPACIDNSVKSRHYRNSEQQFHGPMEVYVVPHQSRACKNNPRENGGEKQEGQYARPNRG